MTHPELSCDSFRSGHISLHPWVTADVSHLEPLAGNRLKDGVQEVDELLREPTLLVTGMVTPEHISAIAHDKLVKTVVCYGCSKWWVAGDHDEEHNADSE